MSPPDRDMWNGMLAELRAQHPSICRQWFDDLEPLGIDNGAFRVQAHTPVHRDYLRTHCLDSFNDALQAVSGRLLSVRFIGPGEHHDPSQDREHTAARPGADRLGSKATEHEAAESQDRQPPAETHAPGDRPSALPSAPERGAAEQPAANLRHRPAVHPPGRAADPRGGDDASARHPTDHLTPLTGHATGSPNGAPNGAPNGDGPASFIDAKPNADLPPANPYEPASPAAPADHHPLRLAGSTNDGPSGERVASQAAPPTPPSRDDALVINPDHTFDTFVVGPSNRLAHAAAVAVANAPGRSYNPLFIHGGVGLGKTHLLQAIALRVHEANPRAIIYYLSCESFMSQFVEAVQQGRMNSFRQRFRDVDVLIVDDIHFLAKGDTSQEEFFHTFNTLHHASKQIVLSSDAPPEDIPHLEERLVSRFKWGLVAPVDPPGFETRIEILKSKARIRGLDLEHEVASFVAGRLNSNIRELEGALTQLQMRSRLDSRAIDIELAKEALGERPASAKPQAPTLERIIEAVTDFYGVRLADLQSKRRHRSVTLPRQVCMQLARKLTRNSLEEIGGYFGGRDHTTVMHAVKAVEQKRSEDPEFARVLDSFEKRLAETEV